MSLNWIDFRYSNLIGRGKFVGVTN